MSLDFKYREVETLSTQVLSMVLNMLDGDSGSIMLLDSAEKVLRITSYRGISPRIAEEVKEALGEGIAGYALKKRISLILNRGDTFLGKTLLRNDIGSSIVLPVLDGESRIGVININRSPDKDVFSSEDLVLANLLSRYFSILIKEIWTYHKNLEVAKLAKAQYKILRNISNYKNIPCIMRYLLQALLKLTKATSGAIATYDGDMFKIIYTIPEGIEDMGINIESLFDNTLEEKKVIYNENELVFPLLYKEEILGCVYLAFEKGLPEHRDIKRLEILLRDVTIIIKNLLNCLFLRETILKDERTRITNTLHDRVCQGLTEGILKIQCIKKLKLSKDILSEINELESLLKNVLNDVRCIIYEEKPIILEGGLFNSLKRYIEGIEKVCGIKFNLTLSGNERLIPKKIKEIIFSVVREAIINVRRHSEASIVDIDFRAEKDRIDVEIIDNGIGFDYQACKNKCNSFGIKMMEDKIQSLGGNFEIESVPNRGTKVRFYVPL